MAAAYTAKDILAALDEGRPVPGARPAFPILDEAYVYPADVRLSAYRDDRDWAIVIERLGFMPRAVGHGGIRVWLYFYGSGVTVEKDRWGHRQTTVEVTSDGPDGPTFKNIQDVRRNVRSIRIRDKVVPVSTDPAFYAARQIDLEFMSEREIADVLRSFQRQLKAYEKHPPKEPVRPDELKEREAWLRKLHDEHKGEIRFMGQHLLRGLLPEHRQELLATEAERGKGLRDGLPLFMQLDEWQHPDIMNRELPSEMQSFQMLADAMASGEKSRYRPTVPPNTHWRNWPEGGSL